MANRSLWKFVAAVMAAFLVYSPSLYACTRQGCVSPCISQPLVYDYTFDEGCSYWITTGSSTVDTSNGGSVTIDEGAAYQEISVGSYSSMALSIEIAGIYGNGGTERYRLLIQSSSGATLETVDVFWPADNPSGRYDYDISNYSNTTIRVYVGRFPGTDPGDTTMVVNWIEMWGRY